MFSTVIARATAITTALCKKFEGFYSRPYLCPAKVWTQGYGATTRPDGTPIRPTDARITEATGSAWLSRQLSTVYVPGTVKMVPTATTPGKLAGLSDFSFNLGLTRLKGSTLRKRALAGDWEGVEIELRKWNRGGGRVLTGLVRRREAEIAVMRADN